MRINLLLLMLCAAMFPAGAVHAQGAADTAPLRVFDATELSLKQYTVVRRIWGDSWRTAFQVPKFQDAGEAVQSLVAEATRAGADGLINVHCLNDRGRGGNNAYFCYGNAIRLRQ